MCECCISWFGESLEGKYISSLIISLCGLLLIRFVNIFGLNSKAKGNASSKRQHVHGCSLVRARRFYGYHSSEELFIKIYLYPSIALCTGKGGVGCMVKKKINIALCYCCFVFDDIPRLCY